MININKIILLLLCLCIVSCYKDTYETCMLRCLGNYSRQILFGDDPLNTSGTLNMCIDTDLDNIMKTCETEVKIYSLLNLCEPKNNSDDSDSL